MTVRVSADPAPAVALDRRRVGHRQRPPRRLAGSLCREFLHGRVAHAGPARADRHEWRALAARALEPNVFYEPAFALAAAPVFGRRCRRNPGLVGEEAAAAARLLPGAHRSAGATALNLPVLVGWTHPYAPLGMPLVEREAAEPITARFLSHLAADPRCRDCCCCPICRWTGPFAGALDGDLRRAQMPSADFDRHRPGATGADRRPSH